MASEQPASGSRFVNATAWASIVLSAVLLVFAVLETAVVYLVLDEQRLAQFGDVIPPGFLALARVVSIVFLVITLLVLIASIGLLRRRNWARIAFIVMLAIGIAWSALGIVSYFWLRAGIITADPAIDELSATLEMFSMVLSVILIIVSVWLIRRFTSQAVRDEFR